MLDVRATRRRVKSATRSWRCQSFSALTGWASRGVNVSAFGSPRRGSAAAEPAELGPCSDQGQTQIGNTLYTCFFVSEADGPRSWQLLAVLEPGLAGPQARSETFSEPHASTMLFDGTRHRDTTPPASPGVTERHHVDRDCCRYCRIASVGQREKCVVPPEISVLALALILESLLWFPIRCRCPLGCLCCGRPPPRRVGSGTKVPSGASGDCSMLWLWAPLKSARRVPSRPAATHARIAALVLPTHQALRARPCGLVRAACLHTRRQIDWPG